MAKLISANDTSGYTYRGRFLNSGEAAGVSYEVSQGAHNALKWLIKNQGRNYGGRVYITWNPKGYIVPDIYEDSLEALFGNCENIPNTAAEFAKELHIAMSGYRANISYYDDVVIMGIDAATTGRMAVTFYREERFNDLLDNLQRWHVTCAWKHRYKKDKELIEFYGAPAPKDIALAAFGVERTNYLEMDDKLKKNTIERILPCIIDGVKLPYDIVKAVYGNACHPQNYKNYFTWHKVLSISCALLKKYYYDKSEEEWTVELNEREESMPYLCGRLLAVADALEKRTYSEEDKKHRVTNAIRYFTKFMEHPCQTWETINKSLQPYIAKLGGSAIYYQDLLGKISKKINEYDFLNERNLDGRMVLGFYAQQNAIYSKKDNKAEENIETDSDSKEKED
jgi:CRISPR-associated protein Csd1